MSQWQPIDSAPKDGTRLRLKRVYQGDVIAEGEGYFGACTVQYAPEDGGPRTFIGVWCATDGAHFFPMPTHWQPSTEGGS